MPLLDLKSNLKNLRYGADQPGYGASGLPYIQTQMPDVENPTGTFKPIFRPGSTGNLDYPIRGGQLEFQVGSQTFTLSSQLDKTRIKRFFDDKKRGAAFIEKQIGLQLSNPKIETGNTLYGIPQAFSIPGILENTRVYNNGQNTLAQVGASGTGAHAIRHGLVPFNPFQKQYFSIVNEQNISNNGEKNRMLILRDLKMSNTPNQFSDASNILNINTVNTLGISLNKNILFQYLGGPGSVYGIGVTTIKRSVDTTKLNSITSMTYTLLQDQKAQNQQKVNYDITDFRETLKKESGAQLENNKNFKNTWTKEQTIQYRFYVSGSTYVDKINKLYPFVFNNSIAPWSTGRDGTDDLIKFVFEAISNDNPRYSTALFFRAFLISGITDNNSATLNPFKYIGRGENFYTYQGFDRTIGFSFRVAAQSKEELRPIYNRLNNLISQVYPDYSPVTSVMRAPLIRMTIGDYIYRMPGFLESVNITVDNAYPWELNLDGDSAQLPKVFDVQVSFKPIFDVLPQRSKIDEITRNTTLNNQELTSTTIEEAITNVTPLIANNNTNFIDTNPNKEGSIISKETFSAGPGPVTNRSFPKAGSTSVNIPNTIDFIPRIPNIRTP